MRSNIFWFLLFSSIPFIIKKPYWGAILYVVLNIIRPEMLFWGGDTGSKCLKIIMYSTLISIIINFKKIEFKNIYNREIFLLIWLYFGIMLSIQFSDYHVPEALGYAEEILKLIVLCAVIVLTIDTPHKVLLFIRSILSAIAILGLWGIEQHFRGNVRLEGLGGQSFGDTNTVAALFVLFCPLCLIYFLESKEKKTKIMYLIGFTIMVVLVVFTNSRGGFLGLCSGVMYFVLNSNKKKKYLTWIAIVLIAVSPFVGQQYKERLATMKVSKSENLEGSSRSRLILWQAGLMVFFDNPLIGTGFLTYPQAKMQYEHKFNYLDSVFKAYVFRYERKKVTHNTYVQLLSDGGIVTFLPFFLLITTSIVLSRKQRKTEYITYNHSQMKMALTGIEYGVVGYCVCIIFIDSITFIFLPIMITISSILRRLISTKEDQVIDNEQKRVGE